MRAEVIIILVGFGEAGHTYQYRIVWATVLLANFTVRKEVSTAESDGLAGL